MKSICPLELFTCAEELEEWIAKQPNMRHTSDAILWFSNARQMQEDAMADGYLIQAEIWTDDYELYSVCCTALLEDGSLYWWCPEDRELHYILDTRHF